MKKLRNILLVMLSLLVIYSGVGVSVCSCFTCEVACLFCSTPCSSCTHDEVCTSDEVCGYGSDCGHDNALNIATCKDEGCTVNVYKVNLTKHNTQWLISVLSVPLSYELLPDFQSVLPLAEAQTPYVVPPCLAGSRHFLALYSTLLI